MAGIAVPDSRHDADRVSADYLANPAAAPDFGLPMARGVRWQSGTSDPGGAASPNWFISASRVP